MIFSFSQMFFLFRKVKYQIPFLYKQFSTPNTMEDPDTLLSKLTLQEKADLCTGADSWHTYAVNRLGVPQLYLTDGPHGLRMFWAEEMDTVDTALRTTTCFPTAVSMASTWNRELLYKVGRALAEECQAHDVGVLLGPGVNIKRSPLCGRNFEYYSEDPFLSSHMAAAYIEGVQSGGVGTAIKHFAANNQETSRGTSSNSVVDERTLREIYLATFEYAVKVAKPWMLMTSYNMVNGLYASENEWLLKKVLREEWGYEGVTVSDWGAVDERVEALRAGLDLDMPSSWGINNAKIVAAVKNGKVGENVLDASVKRILELNLKRQNSTIPNATYDKDAHHSLALLAAREALVLLKNENGLLPLQRHGVHVAVIGEFAKKPRVEGSGSSQVNPIRVESAWDAMCELVDEKNLSFAAGYSTKTSEVSPTLLEEAVRAAQNADVALLFVGVPRDIESFDREDLSIPVSHVNLIKAVVDVQPKVVVVLSNGAPVEMPWMESVPAILEAYLPGQAGGRAVADVLFAVCCPSGRLAETFPKRLQDTPTFPFYPEKEDAVYREGIFVGYRYYDMKGIEPLFPFGHGLSYTEFQYSDLAVEVRRTKKANDNDTALDDGALDVLVVVTLTVTNTGKMAGKEVVQLYIQDMYAPVVRPEKELKEFAKVLIQPGESKRVTFELDRRSFAYYSEKTKEWRVHNGKYTILVGASSRDIRLRAQVEAFHEKVNDNLEIHRNIPIKEALRFPEMVQEAKNLMNRTGFPGMDEGTEMYEMACNGSIRGICRTAGASDEEMEEFLQKLRLANSKAQTQGSNGVE